jgi:hypothetical protein
MTRNPHRTDQSEGWPVCILSYIIFMEREVMKNDKFYSELNKFMNKGHKRGSGHLYDIPMKRGSVEGMNSDEP